MAMNLKARMYEIGSRFQQAVIKHVVGTMLTTEVIAFQASAITEDLFYRNEAVEIEGFSKEYENFIPSLRVLNLAHLEGQGQDEEAYMDFFSKEVWVSPDFSHMVVRSSKTGNLIMWPSMEVVDEPYVDGFTRLKPALITPAGEKKREASYLEWDGDLAKFEENLAAVTGGLYPVLVEYSKIVAAKRGGLTFKELVKLVGNMSQGMPPSGKLDGHSVKTVAILMSKDIRGFADGAGYYLGKHPAQLRSKGWTDKWFGLGVGEDTMMELINHYGPVTRLKEVGPEDQAELIKAWVGDGKFAEQLVVIGEGTPDVFIDLNILKTPVDFMAGIPEQIRVLDFAGMKREEEVVFGTQMAFAMVGSEEGMGIYKDLMVRTIEDVLIEYDNAEPSVLSFDRFEQERSHLAGLINKVNPFWKNFDNSLKRLHEGALVNRLNGALNFQVKAEGRYLHVFPDPGREFGVTLFEDDECFAADFEEGQKVLGNRSPKGPIHGQDVNRNVPLEELFKRIAAAAISGGAKASLKKVIGDLKTGSGTVFVSASEWYKFLHNGMDHDFDAESMFKEESLVRFFRPLPAIAHIVTDEGDTSDTGELFKFDSSAVSTVISRQFNSGNLPIGMVCNHNHTWVALQSDLRLARLVLRDLFGHGSELSFTGLKYVKVGDGRYTVESNAVITDEIIAEIGRLDHKNMDDADVIRVLKDINMLMDRFIQKTVDASKTGETIVIPRQLLVNEIVKTASLTESKIWIHKVPDEDEMTSSVMELVEGKLFVSVPSYETSYTKRQVGKKLKYFFNDDFNRVRREVYEEIVEGRLVEMASTMAEVDEEIALARDGVKYPFKDMLQAKMLYGDIVGSRMESLQKAKRREEAQAINAEFKDTVSYLTNTARLVTRNLTPRQRALAAFSISTWTEESIYASPSTFPLTVFPEEYLLLAASHTDGIDFVGERIKPDNALKDGDVVLVKNEVRLGFECHADLADGAYVIRTHNGVQYATKSIQEILLPDMVTNKKLIVRLSSGQDFSKVSESLAGEEVFFTTWQKGAGGKDTICGKFNIDVPQGMSGYKSILDIVTGDIKKSLVSKVKNENGIKVPVMFIALEVTGRKTAEKAAAAAAANRRPLKRKKAPVDSPVMEAKM